MILKCGGTFMKKFARLFLSGYGLVLAVLLIEVIAIVFVQFFLDDFLKALGVTNFDQHPYLAFGYVLLKVVTFIIEVVIFFKIVNKSEDPEFKIPWIVAMLLLPIFASIMFLIFGNHGLRKRDRKIVEKSRDSFVPCFGVGKKEAQKQEQELGRAYGAFNYLKSTTRLGIHKNNRVTYYKNGETFFPAFIEGLKQAEEFIFIEFFIIADGKEWSAVQKVLIEKAKAGVDVRVVYDDMGCGSTISGRTPKILRKSGIKCYKFHPFRPILSGVYNNRDHRKIVVIDHKMAFTGGINLADEYANEIERFGYWKDTMVKIEGSAINNLITVFLENYNLACGRVSDYAKYLLYDYPKFEDEGFVMPFGDGPGGFDNALIGEQNYINILNYAQKTCFISTPYLVPTYSLLDAMRNAALRGVDVHLIVPGIPDKKLVYAVAKSHFKFLLDAGVHIHIYTPGFNHMKSAIVDDELAFVGTINFDFRSLVHHFECGTILYKNSCMKEIREDFDEMVKQSREVPKNYKMNRPTRNLCTLIKLFTPLL